MPRRLSTVLKRWYVLAMLLLCATIQAEAQTATPAVAAATIDNQANANYLDIQYAAQATVQSNTVSATVGKQRVASVPPTVAFYRDDRFTTRAMVASFDQRVYLQGTAMECNSNASSDDWATITVRALKSGDVEVLKAKETISTSGVFRVQQELWVKSADDSAVVHQDGIFQVAENDQLEASINACGGVDAQAWLLVDPMGVVFDSVTNQAIAGAQVRLIDVTGAGNGGQAGGDAVVYATDGVTRLPATAISNERGQYRFPLLPPSTYEFVVTPPGDYSFPSQRSAGQLPRGRYIHLYGSYGGNFVVGANTGSMVIDVPLDSNPGGLFVQKTASRTEAEIAESIGYTVVVKNVSGMPLGQMTIRDELPRGFTYIAGSARVDGVGVADPQGAKNQVLTFDLQTLETSSSKTLTYRAMVGPAALQGDGINRAQAISTQPALKNSNVAKAVVKINGGVFDDKAFVVGKVFADCNRNSAQDANEPGIAGVRLYMEDGSFVITDGNGNYSFYGVTPRTHVLKADKTTLPTGAKLIALSHRNAGNGNSIFLDVKSGELHRADFAVDECSEEFLATIKQRRVNALGRDELTDSLKNELKLDNAPIGDVRALPASGIVGGIARSADANGTNRSQKVGANNSNELERLIHGLDGQIGFVGLNDGDTVRSNQIDIVVKTHANYATRMWVNEIEVPASRIGSKVIDPDKQVELHQYIGVDLKTGENELTISEYNEIRNIRTSRQIHVMAPGPLAQLQAHLLNDNVDADGEVHARLSVELADEAGLPVTTRTAITLESTLGEWQVIDVDTREPGVQTFVEGGSAEFSVRSPSTPGIGDIRVTAGKLSSEARINFVPTLRPMLASGLIEGTINLSSLSSGLQATHGDDGFEQELKQVSGGDVNAGARAALFLKGKVKGDYLLTLSYDSDKDTHDRLFRDIDPDKYYPVYGDSSTKGFDAQSTGKLYVRIDKGASYFLVGDLTTQSISQARNLSAYNRNLTGVKEHYQQGRWTVDAFASRDTTRQIVDEIPANGTSGPYPLRTLNAVENSERVEIITRDRNQPSIILSAVPQQRFTDYEIESFTGHLVMRGPVPSFDQNLNPVSIRVTYEVDQGGEQFWIGGVDSKLDVSKRLSVGAVAITDRNPQDAMQLNSINATFNFDEFTSLTTEVARSNRDSTGSGNAERIEFRHTGKELQARTYFAKTDADFNNPSASLGANRTEGNAKLGYSLTESTRLQTEALYTSDNTTSAERTGGLVTIEHSVGSKIKIESGARYVHDNGIGITQLPDVADTSHTTTSVRGKITTPVPLLSAATAYTEYEQDVRDEAKRLAAIGGDYQVAQRTRIYARHEFMTSLSNVYALNTAQRQNVTVIGIDTSYLQDQHVFSEYRVNNEMSGRDAQAAIGLRNRWILAEGLRLTTNFERVQALAGSQESDSNAVATGIEYTRNPLWKGTVRLEWRTNATSDGYFASFGLARKLNADWSLLGKNVLAIDQSKSGQAQKVQDRLQVGVAYRDSVDNLINGLARYEFKNEKNAEEIGMLRRVHIVAGHVDYQPLAGLIFNGQYAVKLAFEDDAEGYLRTTAQIVGGRVTRDLGKHWDIGAATRVLLNNTGYQSAVGAEVGYLVHDGLWVSGGANIIGFHDRDLSVEEYTDRGVYMRMRYKFDESILGGG